MSRSGDTARVRVSWRVFAVALLIVISASAPVSAQVSLGDLTDDDDSFIDAVLSFAQGIADRFRNSLDRSEWDPDDVAQDVQEFYINHNSSFEDYVNSRSTADSSRDVLRIELNSRDDSATVYLVSDVNGTNYENSTVEDDTERTSDEWVSLCGPAAKNAHDELKQLHDEFVEEDDDVTRSYVRRLAAEYGGQVTSSLTGHEEECDA